MSTKMNVVKGLRDRHDISSECYGIFGIRTIPKHPGSCIDDIAR